MFYAFLLLGKKGPLAKVWLAAHWEKKLTKANVFETDVESSVERIKAPPVKISLRTSGHLLLGLSRIYLRKAKYLFQDCNEVFMKIRMAFRPGAVDLPPQTREADPQVITLPDLFRDFENAVADLNDVNLENEFAIPESRMREITMQDDSRNLDRLDNFMDMGGGFGEGDGDFELSSLEVLRDAIGPEDSILHESRDRPELDVSKAKSLKNDSLDQLSVEKAPNRVRESFGMGFGEMDGGFGPEHGELTSLEDLGMGLPSIDETAGLPLGSPQHDQTEDMETNQLPSDNNIIPKKRDAGSVMSDFTLASLDVSTVTFKKPHPPGEEGTPVVKKRKSTIANVSTADVEVKLSTNEIRNWFEDQSDIEVDIISAPANKIALLPRLTSEQKPFEIPTSNGTDEGLSRLVLLNCTVAEKVGSDDEDPNQSTVEDVLRGVGSMDEHISMADMDPINLEPIVHDQDTTNESHLLDAEDKHHTRESTAGFGEVGHDTYDQITGDPLQGIDMPTLEEEESLMNGDEDLGPKEDERPDEYERRKWNKKTQQVLNQVSKAFGKKASSVPFSKVLDSSSRKQAATNFFSLLLLTTRGSLKLQQDEPYGDLLITKGPAYQACIS